MQKLQIENSEMITSHRISKQPVPYFHYWKNLTDIERICKPFNHILNVTFDELNSHIEGVTSNDTTKRLLIMDEVELPAKKMKPNLKRTSRACNKSSAKEYLKNQVVDNTLLMNHFLGMEDEEEAMQMVKNHSSSLEMPMALSNLMQLEAKKKMSHKPKRQILQIETFIIEKEYLFKKMSSYDEPTS
ncbi:hypothetical protein PR048_011325, partial [Dryococelus australis]